jgi:hypothetical protein
VIYLSGVSSPRARQLAETHALGLMVQPGNSLALQIPAYRCWAADNGCFARGEAFDPEAWLRWLDGLPRDGCLFAVAPDVLGDPVATLERSGPWLARIREVGFPAAYVAQDGIDGAPWAALDVLFIGGSTGWKLSPAASRIAGEARARGVPVHMGRVNSLRRLSAAALMGCRSVDGTYLAFRARRGPEVGERELASWLDVLEREPFLPLA